MNPVIAPFELVDIEYGKIGAILSIFVDKTRSEITLNDTAVDLTEIISPVLDTIKPDPSQNNISLEITSSGLNVL